MFMDVQTVQVENSGRKVRVEGWDGTRKDSRRRNTKQEVDRMKNGEKHTDLAFSSIVALFPVYSIEESNNLHSLSHRL